MFVVTIGIIIGCSSQTSNVDTTLSTPVTVMDIKPRTIREYINTSGTVYAMKQATLNSQMAGEYQLRTNPATGRTFKLGDRVTQGQVIIRIQDREYENNIAIDAKKLNLDIAQQQYDKQKSLFELGGVTQRELTDAEVSLANAKYSYETALLNLEKMNVTDPFNGVIVDLPFYTQNTRVASGQQMVTIMDYSQMYMEINLPEKNLSTVKVGQPVLITSYTLPDDTLKGTVSDLSPMVSSETRTFKGNLLISNPDLKLRHGMFVKADIIVNQKDSVIVIPKDIILSGTMGKTVFTVNESSARERRITLGIESVDSVEVVSGLEVNNQLIISGYETLRNGSKINIVR